VLKYDFIPLICLWCGGKIGSFGFACVSACGWGKAKCANEGWHKIELKKVRWKKIKNTEGSAKSVGLLVVHL